MYTRRAVAFSVLLHAALVAVMTLSIDLSPEELRPFSEPREIVQAVAVDRAAVDREVERLRAEEEKARREREQALKESERKARAAEEKRRAEEKRLKELEAEKKRLSEQKEKERQAAERRKAEAEKQRKAEEEQRRRAEEEQRREAEARRRAEEAAAEAERKRIEQALQAEMAAEEAARQAAADDAEIRDYVARIARRVRQSFTILPGLDGLSCTIRIALIPGGEVAQVEIVKSSGNPTFDRQAENAVRKAAPLPVPTEPRLFQQMRSITFVFDPQN